MNRQLIWTVAGAALLTTACGSSTEPEPRVQPGVISFFHDPVLHNAPDTVEAGAAFEVSVRTYGGGCITEERTDVRIEGGIVHVRPLDRHSGWGVCTDELRMFDHTASVRLDVPGTVEILFHGTAMPGDSAVSFTRTVRVE